MNYLILALYVLSVFGAVQIARKRGRWVAVPLSLFLPLAGFLVSLCLRKRCRWCREYMSPGAVVCPHCCRNLAPDNPPPSPRAAGPAPRQPAAPRYTYSRPRA